MNIIDRKPEVSGNNICALLRRHSDVQPDKTVFRYLNSRGRESDGCSYREFDEHTNGLAACLRADAGILPGMVVALLYSPGLDFIRAFIACVKLGALPVPVAAPNLLDSRSGLDDLAHILDDADAKVALCSTVFQRDIIRATKPEPGTGEKPESKVLRRTRWFATDIPVRPLANFACIENELLFLQYTSGSTTRPRGVMVSHANVVHNCGLCINHPNPVGVSWLPHYHDMGLIGSFLFTIVSGGECTFFSPLSFMRRPVLWLDTIARYRATLTTAPDFAYAYCLREDKISEEACCGLDLSSMKLMINASEPVKSSTYWNFLNRFEPFGLSRRAYVAGYGLAENTLAVTLSNGAPDGPCGVGSNSPQPLGCGKPAAGVTVALVDPVTLKRVDDGKIGEIWIDGPSKAMGYHRKQQLSEETFQAQIVDEANTRGYLRTGDLGFLKGGELHVSGRLKDMILIRGRNLFPADLEQRIEKAFPRLDPGSVAVFGACGPGDTEEMLVAMIEDRTGADLPPLRDVLDLVSIHWAAPRIAIVRVKNGSIIRTTSGKIARSRLADKWIGERIPALEKLEFEEALEGALEPIFQRIRDAAHSGNAATLESLSMNSVDLVSLELWIEERVSAAAPANSNLPKALVDLRILQEMRMGDLHNLIVTLENGNIDGTALLSKLATTFTDIQKADKERMRGDIEQLSIKHSLTGQRPSGGASCFVTGATGFLGSHLLRALLEQTDDHVFLLVRCEHPAAGEQRIRDALINVGVSSDLASSLLKSRITVLPGSLAHSRLGLDDGTWAQLSGEISRIYHSGAVVDYVQNYHALRDANVCATSALIELAAQGCVKTIHFVSTTFIFGWTAADSLLENGFNTDMTGLNFGYAQSKWVAEWLVNDGLRSGVDVKIYRPSLLTASRQGCFVEHDITVRMLGYMLRHGVFADIGNQISMVPVDICAANIVALSRNDRLAATHFHVTTDVHHRLSDICDIVSRNHGYRIEKLSLDDFIAHVNQHCDVSDPLYPLRPFINNNYGFLDDMRDKIYDNSNYRDAVRSTPGAFATPELADVIRPIIGFLQDRQLIAMEQIR